MGCVFWSYVEFMPPEPISGFSSMHRLAARCCSPSDTNWLAQFSRVFGVSVMLGCMELISMMCV